MKNIIHLDLNKYTKLEFFKRWFYRKYLCDAFLPKRGSYVS